MDLMGDQLGVSEHCLMRKQVLQADERGVRGGEEREVGGGAEVSYEDPEAQKTGVHFQYSQPGVHPMVSLQFPRIHCCMYRDK